MILSVNDRFGRCQSSVRSCTNRTSERLSPASLSVGGWAVPRWGGRAGRDVGSLSLSGTSPEFPSGRTGSRVLPSETG
uniref:Uncharacterized protein n=1 Tax=Anguilla anguilla TaxID=7936 RepID=A0A0E9WV46_ANGAN